MSTGCTSWSPPCRGSDTMFERIRTSRNAKNRPKKLGEIYGDNLNSVADVASGLDNPRAQLSGRIGMIDEDRVMMATMHPRKYPVMGVDVPEKAIDTGTIRKLKLRPNERFDVSTDGKNYILDDGKVRYSIPIDDADYPPKAPDLSDVERNETSVEIDTSVIEDVYKDAQKYMMAQGRRITRGGYIETGATIVADGHGVTIQAIDKDGEPIGPARILSTKGTSKEYVSTYPVAYLRNLVTANPKGTLSFEEDYPMVFKWDDPTYEGRLILAPRICGDGDDDGYQKMRNGLTASHRAAFGSSNRRRNAGRRTYARK